MIDAGIAAFYERDERVMEPEEIVADIYCRMAGLESGVREDAVRAYTEAVTEDLKLQEKAFFRVR